MQKSDNFTIAYEYAISIIDEYHNEFINATQESEQIVKDLVQTLHSCYWAGLLKSSEFNLILAYMNGKITDLNPNFRMLR